MTIVAWDGVQLSVDSKRTTYAKDRHGVRYKKRETDSANKITIFGLKSLKDESKKRLFFNGEIVLAAARCGSFKTTQRMLKILQSGYDLERQLTLKHSRGKLPGFKQGKLFILTETSAWVCQYSTDKGVIVTEVKNDPFAMGDNTVVAKFLMIEMKVDAMHAAAGVTLTSRKCGGVINTVIRDPANPKFAKSSWVFATDDKNDVRLLVRHFIALEVIHEGKQNGTA